MPGGSVLRYLVASVIEMGLPVHRQKLVSGLRTGYAFMIGFGVLAFAAWAFQLPEWRWAYAVFFVINFVTNSCVWLALRARRGVRILIAINLMSDAVLLTGIIYFTGGAASPLMATYVLLIASLALFSNLGVTILMAGFILVSFSTMMILMAAGVLPPQPSPGASGHEPVVGFALTAIGFCVLMVGVTAFFSGATLHALRAREAALEKRTALLIQAATQRNQFVASMTHELRTPIHGVQGLSDVIAAGVYGPITDEQKDACASIKHGAQNLLSLVDDLLALTRAEAGKIEARPSAVDIPALVERVTASVSWMVGTKDLSLHAELAPGLPTVVSDERLLAHVLVNLVSNAVKLTPEGGRVTVRATHTDGAVVLEVFDTGIGIAPEERAAIFEPFRRIDRGDAKGYGGVGLGLALVMRLTDLLGATVELDSIVGKGSTFRVILPPTWRGRSATQPHRAAQPPAIAEHAPVRWHARPSSAPGVTAPEHDHGCA